MTTQVGEHKQHNPISLDTRPLDFQIKSSDKHQHRNGIKQRGVKHSKGQYSW